MGEGKISIYRFMSAGCNGCDVQILECLVPRYRLEELGVEIVSTPEEANVLAITGGINVKGLEELKNAYERLRPPKIVIAVGNCAVTKGIFSDGYPMVGPPDQIVPVNLYIPGCPPRPQAIVSAIAKILGASIEMREDYWHTPKGFRGKHEFDGDKCIGCGACAQICSSEAIEVHDEDERRIIRVNLGRCTFCAFCQDMCPTEAIRLTEEYHLSTVDREDAYVGNEVEMLRCRICGSYYAPVRQVDWAIKRAIEEANIKDELAGELRRAAEVCPDCRMRIDNIRRAKRILLRLSLRAWE